MPHRDHIKAESRLLCKFHPKPDFSRADGIHNRSGDGGAGPDDAIVSPYDAIVTTRDDEVLPCDRIVMPDDDEVPPGDVIVLLRDGNVSSCDDSVLPDDGDVLPDDAVVS